MINYVRKVEETVSNWLCVSVSPHRFDGREFVFGSAEVGHMHTGGIAMCSWRKALLKSIAGFQILSKCLVEGDVRNGKI